MTNIDTSLPSISKLENAPVIILGLGREGWSSYQFLRQLFPDKKLILVDEKKPAQLDKKWQQAISSDPHANFLQPSAETIEGGFIFRSPGISPQKVASYGFTAGNFSFTSNSQQFFEIIRDLKTKGAQVTTIGVTGTKGKSTTASVLHQVLSQTLLGKKILLGGNIGTAPLDVLAQLDPSLATATLIILELSSHQLLDLTISPNIAIIQAVTPEHLDYYETFDDYAKAKQPICKFQKAGDITIYNHDNEIARQIAALSLESTKLGFSLTKPAPDNKDVTAWLENGWLVTAMTKSSPQGQLSFAKPTQVIETNTISLPGQHNLYNVLPSVALAQLQGVDASTLAESLNKIKGLPHRLELVAKVGGVSYYNDSLATTPEATIAALDAFADQPVVLIAGGYDRGLDYSSLAEKIHQGQVKAIILLPPSGQRIAAAIDDASAASNKTSKPQPQPPQLKVIQAESMTSAVNQAKELAQAGEVVLLSPASPSFGIFKDYAQRGDEFKKLV